MTKLEEYIKKARASGYDDITIKDNLKKAGWPEENIEPFLKKDESEDMDSFIQPKKEDTVVRDKKNAGIVEKPLNPLKTDKKNSPGKKNNLVLILLILLPILFFMGMMALTALAYFGVFSPNNLERCQAPPGIECIEIDSITETGITFLLRNNRGFEIIINGATSEGCSNHGFSFQDSIEYLPILNVPNNQIVNVRLDCDLEKGDKVVKNIYLKFINPLTELEETSIIELRGKVR